jgi:murein L,D-transpeptidase YcbB/YkuD
MMSTLRPSSEGRAMTDRTRAPRRLLTIVVWTAVAAAVLAGCAAATSDVDRAQTQVTAKEKAVADAQAAFTKASGDFCEASKTYIDALDRYGDVLHQTAPTVGDRAALAKAQAGPSSAPTYTATPKPTATPLAPSASVDRVKQAETDFTNAQASVTEKTALTDASEQFNSAVVALEMSWLKLFADAGCLSDDQAAQAEAAVVAYTTALQQDLTTAKYYTGDVDGVYGPLTVQAVEALQKAHGLPVTGTVDKATADALQSDLEKLGGAAAQEEVASTAAVQQTLKLLGYWDGPVDGTWTPELTDAVKKFQKTLGVEQTGTVDAATVAAFEKAIADAQQPAPTPTPSPTA